MSIGDTGSKPFFVVKENNSIAEFIIPSRLIEGVTNEDQILKLIDDFHGQLLSLDKKKRWFKERGASIELLSVKNGDTSYRIVKIDPKTKDPFLKIMGKRMERDKIAIWINSPLFKSEKKDAEAFAIGNTLHFRKDFFDKSDIYKRNVFAHELKHAKNTNRCREKNDCTGTIAFDIFDDGKDSRPLVARGYKSSYRTDELEAHEQGLRFGQRRLLPSSISDSNVEKEVNQILAQEYSGVSRFFNQRAWIEDLRDQMKSGKVKVANIEDESFRIRYRGRNIEVSFDSLDKKFDSVEEARDFYIDTLTRRLIQLDNRKKAHKGFKRKIKGP